jgi:20S proteasome subunit alpha 7
MYMHAHTLYGAIRPFGVSVILCSFEDSHARMYVIEPSGVSYVSL